MGQNNIVFLNDTHKPESMDHLRWNRVCLTTIGIDYPIHRMKNAVAESLFNNIEGEIIFLSLNLRMVDEANVTMDTIRRKTVLTGCSGFMIATDDGSTRQQKGCALFLSARIHKKSRNGIYHKH